MSLLSRSSFETSADGVFADNSTREISEQDMRDQFDNIKDSTVFKNDDYDYWIKVIAVTGTDTYAFTAAVPVAYAADEKWILRFANSNTGPATLNRSSIGAAPLLTNTGGALSAGDIVAGGTYIVIRNIANDSYHIMNVVAGTGSVSGLTSPRIPYASSATTLADDAVGLHWDSVNKRVGLGIAAPDRIFHVEVDSAATNTVTYLQRLTSTSTGTPAAGIGVGMEFEIETSAANNEVGATMEARVVDATLGSEDIELRWSTMWNGTKYGSMKLANGALTIGGDDLPGAGVALYAGGAASNMQLSIFSKGTSNVQIGVGDSSNYILITPTRATVQENFGINGAGTFGGATGAFSMLNASVDASSALAGGVILHSKDSSDADATLALYTEQAVEVIGTFTASHKLKIWINGVEYWIQLDAV